MYSGPSNMLLKRPIYLQDPTGDKEKCLTRTFKKSRMKSVKHGHHLFFILFLFIHTTIFYRKNSFPYKNKILIKANRKIKPIMNQNVKTNKLPTIHTQGNL